MQLRAYDKQQIVVFAHDAKKHRDYYCLECRGIMRLRSGIHRQKHFYHHCPSKNCRQSGKSMEHLQNQLHIKQLLGEECVLEYPFPTIGRIADCLWTTQKIVFEIQCSPITEKEIAARNRDYASLGYTVIWLLHDSRFNQNRICAAELWLRNHPHYFTNIDAEGKGHIYDQVDTVSKGKRSIILNNTPVSISEPVSLIKENLPLPLKRRYIAWKIAFKGDWIEKSFKEEYRDHVRNIYDPLNTRSKKNIIDTVIWMWEATIMSSYRILFDYLLEKACRS